MLASYDGIRTQACEKCLRIVDDNLQFAVVRDSRKDQDPSKEGEIQWLAYHQKCAS
jgi:hypothetical protein